MTPGRVVIVGMMGSGKSSVGRALAERTGWPFLDNDALLERATGRTAREIAEADGVAGLREAEADALRAGLGMTPPVIVASAAGTILDPVLRAELAAAGTVVWLRAPVATLVERARSESHRPWLDGDAPAWMESALAEREPLYASIADVAIDTGGADPGQVAERVLTALGRG